MTGLKYQIANHKKAVRWLKWLPSLRDIKVLISEIDSKDRWVFKISIIKICLDMHEAYSQFGNLWLLNTLNRSWLQGNKQSYKTAMQING